MLVLFLILLNIVFSNNIKIIGINENKNCSETIKERTSDRYLKISTYTVPFNIDDLNKEAEEFENAIETYIKENTYVKIEACRQDNNFKVYNCISLPRLNFEDNKYYKLDTLIKSIKKYARNTNLANFFYNVSYTAQNLAYFIIGGQIFQYFHASSLLATNSLASSSSLKISSANLLGGFFASTLSETINTNNNVDSNVAEKPNLNTICIKNSKKLNKNDAFSLLSDFNLFLSIYGRIITIDNETIIKLDDYINLLELELLYLKSNNSIETITL